ncbi:MAG: DUF2589 domain-containing protein [Anaeroplasmataceae bacterium]|nr:DUF2589 domain-containing protein [Anaeroplasmataceae bacterium]
MAIAEQFAGLQMDQLIGGPLTAAADASTLLANSTAEFINRVGFNKDGKVRTVAFSYHTRSVNDDGTSNFETMKVDVPMLAIVPIPNLQIDEVNILFDMEVKQSEKSEKSMDLGATLSGSLNLGIVKVSVTGSVSAHSTNTRSSDNSAKYHVDVRATNHGVPEGLARVLDMMAVNINPALVSSTLKDNNGQDLTGSAKERAERLKSLRQEISVLESKVNASKNALDTTLKNVKRIATQQSQIYIMCLTKLANAKTEDGDAEAEKLLNTKDEIITEWNNFMENLKSNIPSFAANNQEAEELTTLYKLQAISKEGAKVAYSSSESLYNDLSTANKACILAQKNVDTLEAALLEKQTEYSNTISKR